MMNIKQNFIHWYYEEFQLDPLYLAMEAKTEDSPWHRERNIGVHTDMVVSEYLSRSNPFIVLGALACAFHDVGKPPAEIIKEKKERGVYRAYHGHEQVSARLWENYAVENWIGLVERFNLIPEDIYTIGWMIEHHVPWATKKDAKLDAFATTDYETNGYASTWASVLLSDQYGRISDVSNQRGEEADIWITDHNARKVKAEHRWKPYEKKIVFMMVGAPGSGKTTYRNQLVEEYGAVIISMDDLRIQFYGGSYDEAWVKSTKDSSFNAKCDKLYVETLRENDFVIVDNTNCFTKARRRWLSPARARDFEIAAVVFPASKDQVVSRQKSREDKEIPKHVVENFYNKLQLPMYGDFDDVIVYDGNLPK